MSPVKITTVLLLFLPFKTFSYKVNNTDFAHGAHSHFLPSALVSANDISTLNRQNSNLVYQQSHPSSFALSYNEVINGFSYGIGEDVEIAVGLDASFEYKDKVKEIKRTSSFDFNGLAISISKKF